MKHLVWLVLNDGVRKRIQPSDVDLVEEARVIDSVMIPLTQGQHGQVAGGDSGYTVTGVIGSKRTLIRLLDNDAAVADIAICLHSRAAPGLWAEINAGNTRDLADIDMPDAPWCAVRSYFPESAIPNWFDIWTQTLGIALVRRKSNDRFHDAGPENRNG